MFHQIVAPLGGSLALSFVVAALPIATVLIMLGILRRAAWQASAAGLVLALVLATMIWELPLRVGLSSIAAGATFALWPVMWIVFNALAFYNITVVSGRFDAFRTWLVYHLPDDRRVVLVVVGFSFGCLLEGIAGFGTPIAITSALLIALGFRPLDAVVFTLMFNTAPVAFGALGSPITTLAAVTQLPDHTLGAMVGRQLPFIALLLPFYVIAVYGGLRALKGVWPALLVAGGSFALAQYISSNFLSYALTDVLSALFSLLVIIGFVKVWRMPHDPKYALEPQKGLAPKGEAAAPGVQSWIPWLVLSAVVIAWMHFHVPQLGEQKIAWPGLDQAVFITTYGKPYAAIWNLQPLATGTAILAATLLTALIVRLSPGAIARAYGQALKQVRLPAATTVLIVALAYLMNYSGMAYTLGIGVASAGILFPLVSAFLGWLAVFLSGSDTSGNALFGNLQVVAARQLDLSPVLMAATNSSGGVMGKMISPQNISTGTAVTDLKGREGEVLARTFKHSIILATVLGVLVMIQQYVLPGMIPA